MLTLPENNLILINDGEKKYLHFAASSSPVYEEQEMRKIEVQNTILGIIDQSSKGKVGELISLVKQKLQKSPYFVLIRGLNVEDNINLLIALSRGLGMVVEPYNKPWSKLIHPLNPSTDWKDDETDTLSENLHTDGTSWVFPNDYTGLVCVQPDQAGGGRSRLIDIDTLIDDFINLLGKETYQKCSSENMPWSIAAELGGGVYWSPILQQREIRWMEHTIRQGAEREKVQLSQEQIFVLDSMNQFLSKCDHLYDFILEKGDYLIFDNKRTLHARTQLQNPRSSQRYYYRVKISKQS